MHVSAWYLEDIYEDPIRMEVLLLQEEVRSRLKISRSHLYGLRSTDPSFPRPIKLGRSARWRAADLDRWIVEQAEGVK